MTKEALMLGRDAMLREPIQESGFSKSYMLDLGDRLEWSLVGNDATAAWLNQLASIMTLTPGESKGLPKIIFVFLANSACGCRAANARPPLTRRPDLPRDGWRLDNLGAARIWSHTEAPDIICELLDTRKYDETILTMVQVLFPIYRGAINQGGVPLHAALLECNGKGILIAGRGGKGKTTCYKLAPENWNALCDDETLVRLSDSGSYRAHPFPTWSDYLLRRCEPTWNVQRPTQVSAVFFLEQGESDQVVPIGEATAVARIMQSAGQVCGRMWGRLESCVQRENNLKLFANACNMAKGVPAFTLRASLAGRFWKNIEKVL